MTYTVLVGNEALGTSRYVGTFESEAEAQAYATREAGRSRRFATFEVWTGKPRAPGRPTKFKAKGGADLIGNRRRNGTDWRVGDTAKIRDNDPYFHGQIVTIVEIKRRKSGSLGYLVKQKRGGRESYVSEGQLVEAGERKMNASEKSCGFAISIYDQSMIEENAAERVREEGTEGFGRLVTKKGEITNAGWDQLNKDVSQLERNSLNWLKKKFGGARDDGHDSDDLVGSVWYDPENTEQMELLELASPSPGRSERIDMQDASFGDLSHTVWEGVSDFGEAVLGGAITFFDCDEEF